MPGPGGRAEPARRTELGGVEQQDRVLGVADDVGDLVGPRRRLTRVQHRAGQRDGEVELEVAVVVARERRHPVARPYAQRRRARPASRRTRASYSR